MEELGELGFWLAAGAVIVALIVRGWLKERDKQAMLRDMMRMESGGNVSEILAYLRERDEAEQKLTRQMWGVGWSRADAVGLVALLVGVAAFIGGLISLALMSERTDSGLAPIAVMAGFWVAGGLIAWLIVRMAGDRKNGPTPDA